MERDKAVLAQTKSKAKRFFIYTPDITKKSQTKDYPLSTPASANEPIQAEEACPPEHNNKNQSGSPRKSKLIIKRTEPKLLAAASANSKKHLKWQIKKIIRSHKLQGGENPRQILQKQKLVKTQDYRKRLERQTSRNDMIVLGHRSPSSSGSSRTSPQKAST